MRGAAGTAEPFISIVVTTKNAVRHLGDVLGDFERLEWPKDRLEVVLVDAFSTDGTWGIAQEFARRAPFPVVAAQRAGYIGAGRNEGFRRARAEFVAVTDADMRVPANWLRELWAAMAPGVGVVGGPNEAYGTSLTSRCAAAIPTHGPSVGCVPLLGKNKWHADYETERDVYAAVTRNSLFRKAAFEEAGGFDETLRVTEDPELNFRILQKGYRIRYHRAAGVQHVHRDTAAAYFHQQRLYAYWQAHVNRKHPAMGAWKHRGPALAALLFVLSLPLGLLERALFLVPAALAVLALLAAIAYALRAAVVRKDPALLFAVPFFFLLWQLAWAIGYPMGSLGRP